MLRAMGDEVLKWTGLLGVILSAIALYLHFRKDRREQAKEGRDAKADARQAIREREEKRRRLEELKEQAVALEQEKARLKGERDEKIAVVRERHHLELAGKTSKAVSGGGLTQELSYRFRREYRLKNQQYLTPVVPSFLEQIDALENQQRGIERQVALLEDELTLI